MKSKILIILLLLCAVNAIATTEEPVMFYRIGFQPAPANIDGKTPEEVLSQIKMIPGYNGSRKADCIASMAGNSIGNCSVWTATGTEPAMSTTYFNGRPTKVNVVGNIDQYTKCCTLDAPVEMTTKTASFFLLSLVNQCENGFTSRVKSSGNDVTITCENKELVPNQCTKLANPINFLSGNKFQGEVDFSGAYGLSIDRTYINQFRGWVVESLPRLIDFSGRFQNLQQPELNACANFGTMFNLWNIRAEDPKAPISTPTHFCLHYIKQSSDPAKVVLRESSGINWDLLYKDDYYGDSLFSAKLYPIDSVLNDGASWLLRFNDNKQEYYDSNGFLIKTLQPNGDYLLYTYSNGNLISKTNRLNQTISYSYDNQGNLISAQLPTGKKVIYGYRYLTNSTAVSVLDTVTYADNSTVHYEYADARFPLALTGAIDGNGKYFANWSYDANGLAITSRHANNTELFSFDYSNLIAASPSVAVTSPLGKKTTYYFTTVNDRRLVTKVVGEPSANCAGANKAYTYTSQGWLASKTDWNNNKTTYTYNTKGQEISRTEAAGTSVAKTINTEWHPIFNVKTKVTEPDKETTYTYGATGLLTGQSVRSLP